MQNKNQRASVIIPTYNRAEFITKSLDSVWAQTYRPIEVLVIDDGSTDNTKDVVEQWFTAHESKDFTAKYIYQKKSGAPAARNTGIKHATGRYLQFSDSDDVLYPNKLELQISKMQEENTPICICGYYHLDENGNILLEITNNRSFKEILQSDLRLSTLISVIDTTLIDAKFLKWNPKLKKYQDRDFHLKLFLIIESFSIIDEPLFEWIRHKGERIFDSTKTSVKIPGSFLKSLIVFYYRNLSKIEPYKRPYIKKLFKALSKRTYITSGLGNIIPKQLKIWHYFK
ncbi:glycosyltransferase family 2 protein [Aequorivita marina]|uniref:glycosyltransferase family 2 protein n=1 Tax=Aequorivita marina TaxID=3073654 RepID=UPI0028744B08|nr:glycosyltransferase family 2 protein [Aequorivita sp. S2608]MDS1299080.1 glycosyltransferase family 2 protein [Aequorivita sp. S2608]